MTNQSMDNTNWKEEVDQKLYFVQVSKGNEIVRVIRWHSEKNRYDVVDEVIKNFKGEFPNHSTILAYEVK